MKRSIIVLLAGLILFPAGAHAERTSCCGFYRAFDSSRPLPSGLLFEGRVIAVRLVPESERLGDLPEVEVEFEVRRSWSNPVPRIVTVRSTREGDCGLSVLVGERYLVAPFRDEAGVLHAGAGSALSVWDREAPAFLDRLGTGRAPTPLSLPVSRSQIPGLEPRPALTLRAMLRPDRDTFALLYSVLAIVNLMAIGLFLRLDRDRG
ncbi:MAG: hypothetical protein AAF389_08095 [Gemmatimonadota bacterium]